MTTSIERPEQSNGHLGNHDILDKGNRALAPIPRGRTAVKKTDKYNWNPIGIAGVMRLIAKGDLHIDGRYQRKAVSADKVVLIAATWDWMKFGSLLVVQREDGSFWVYDGGHRTRASFYRDEVNLLPCMVFPAASLAIEASAFVGTNTLSTAVRAADKHRANLVAGEPVAVMAGAIMEVHGYRAAEGATSPFTFGAIARLQKLVARDANLAERVFSACVAVDEEPGHLIPEPLLAGLFHVALNYGADLALRDDNIARLKEYGIRGIVAVIRRTEIHEGKGGERVWSDAILSILNKGRRTRIQVLAERNKAIQGK